MTWALAIAVLSVAAVGAVAAPAAAFDPRLHFEATYFAARAAGLDRAEAAEAARQRTGSAVPGNRPVPRDPQIAEPTAEAIAAVAKALGHPARVRIVRLLLEKETCIGGDIVDEIGLAQSTVSEHLRILKTAGLIIGEIERPRVCYSLNPESLLPLANLLSTVFEKQHRGELGGSVCC